MLFIRCLLHPPDRQVSYTRTIWLRALPPLTSFVMAGHSLGPAARTRSRMTASAVSFDVLSPAAHDAAVVAASYSLSGTASYADHRSQAEADGGGEKEEAVEGGEMVGASGGPTDSSGSDSHSSSDAKYLPVV